MLSVLVPTGAPRVSYMSRKVYPLIQGCSLRLLSTSSFRTIVGIGVALPSRSTFLKAAVGYHKEGAGKPNLPLTLLWIQAFLLIPDLSSSDHMIWTKTLMQKYRIAGSMKLQLQLKMLCHSTQS